MGSTKTSTSKRTSTLRPTAPEDHHAHLTDIAGLWRSEIKGFRGATARPGSMTSFLVARRREKRLEGKRALPIVGQTYWTPSTAPAEAAARRAKLAQRAPACGGCVA